MVPKEVQGIELAHSRCSLYVGHHYYTLSLHYLYFPPCSLNAFLFSIINQGREYLFLKGHLASQHLGSKLHGILAFLNGDGLAQCLPQVSPEDREVTNYGSLFSMFLLCHSATYKLYFINGLLTIQGIIFDLRKWLPLKSNICSIKRPKNSN